MCRQLDLVVLANGELGAQKDLKRDRCLPIIRSNVEILKDAFTVLNLERRERHCLTREIANSKMKENFKKE